MTPKTMKHPGGAATVNNVLLAVITSLLGILAWMGDKAFDVFQQTSIDVHQAVKNQERTNARVDYVEREQARLERWAEAHGERANDPLPDHSHFEPAQ